MSNFMTHAYVAMNWLSPKEICLKSDCKFKGLTLEI